MCTFYNPLGNLFKVIRGYWQPYEKFLRFCWQLLTMTNIPQTVVKMLSDSVLEGIKYPIE
jgi:hypothetical protein